MACMNSNEIDALRTMFRNESMKVNNHISNHPYGYIYMIVDKNSGRTYIGQRKLKLDYCKHVHKTSYGQGWRRYLSSGNVIHKMINKSGADRMIKCFICYVDNKEDILNVEGHLISYGKSIGKCSLNVASIIITDTNETLQYPTYEHTGITKTSRIDDVVGKQVCKSFTNGMNVADIAQKYDISKHCVRSILHMHDIDTYRGNSHCENHKYTCYQCHKVFTVKRKRHHDITFCSKKCFYASKKAKTNTDKMIELYNSGMSLHGIENYFDNTVSYITIYNRLRSSGVVFRKKGRDRLS